MSGRSLPHYHMLAEGNLICLIDLKYPHSPTITNAAELVIADLRRIWGADFAGKRVIYRDTDDTWDGLAHNGRIFTGFVTLQTKDRDLAVRMATGGIDKSNNPWPGTARRS